MGDFLGKGWWWLTWRINAWDSKMLTVSARTLTSCPVHLAASWHNMALHSQAHGLPLRRWFINSHMGITVSVFFYISAVHIGPASLTCLQLVPLKQSCRPEMAPSEQTLIYFWMGLQRFRSCLCVDINILCVCVTFTDCEFHENKHEVYAYRLDVIYIIYIILLSLKWEKMAADEHIRTAYNMTP